jgi:fucokinase
MSKTIDDGSTNPHIDYIFDSINDLVCGKMIVGAGGGGFLQVLLKKGVKLSTLKKRITDCCDETVQVYSSKMYI